MYEDIINLPHHVSPTRPQMPMADRAAQFSPFAALTGYDAAIQETARLTDSKIDLVDSGLEELNRRLQLLMAHLADLPEVSITYFQPDARKSGGKYREAHGVVKKLDGFEQLLIMQDGTKIPLGDVLHIEGELFAMLE